MTAIDERDETHVCVPRQHSIPPAPNAPGGEAIDYASVRTAVARVESAFALPVRDSIGSRLLAMLRRREHVAAIAIAHAEYLVSQAVRTGSREDIEAAQNSVTAIRGRQREAADALAAAIELCSVPVRQTANDRARGA